MKNTNYIDKTIQMKDILDENKFIIPQFQRNVVWKKKKREAFLRNVLDGDPFGIILIRERDGKYELIDGLQRISTIKDFIKNPFEYLEPSDIDMEGIDNLIKAHLISQKLPANEDNVKEIHEEWQAKTFDFIKQGLKNYEVMSELRKEFNLNDEKIINDIIDEIYTGFYDSINLDNLTIMAINYTGPVENIPNVFYNLNTGGVQLTKYETYAALWYKTKFKVDDEELIEVVKNKYIQLQNDSELDVDFSEVALNEEGITLFEYCYALGGIMRNKENGFQILFPANTKSTDPTGFELLALLLTDKVNKADQLYPLLRDVSPDFLVKLKKILKKSLIEITKALKPLLCGKNKSYLYSESSYLIYHIIVSYIKEYSDIFPQTQAIRERDSDLNKEDFKKYVKHHYFHDCITDFWKNNRQVSDLQKEIVDENRRQKYWHKIKGENWEKAIQLFMDSQKASGKTVSQKNKLFIDFLTKLKIEENPNYGKYFSKNSLSSEDYVLDFEHIVPRKVIEKHIKDLSRSQQRLYPVSAVGNLCYLAAKDNRAKKDKTLYEFTEDRPAYDADPDFLKCINYPSKEDLSFIDFGNDDFREAYDAFINERQDMLRYEFLKLIKYN